jgi:hypothetical protein
MDTSRIRPHISIAYANATLPVSSLLPTLTRLRRLPTVNLLISSVALVEMRRETSAYRYEHIADVALPGFAE